MARIVIVLNDTDDGTVQYQSVCETPEETDKDGNPTPALRLAVKIIDECLTIQNNNEVE